MYPAYSHGEFWLDIAFPSRILQDDDRNQIYMAGHTAANIKSESVESYDEIDRLIQRKKILRIYDDSVAKDDV